MLRKRKKGTVAVGVAGRRRVLFGGKGKLLASVFVLSENLRFLRY